MRALTIRPPWAQAVIHLGKDVENRGWRPPATLPLPFTIMVHSAKTFEQNAIASFDAADLADERVAEIVERALAELGGLIGLVDVVGFTKSARSPWAVPGAWHWMLANPRARPFVRWRGAQGLFDVPTERLPRGWLEDRVGERPTPSWHQHGAMGTPRTWGGR